MTIKTIENKLTECNLKNVIEQENALQEVLQLPFERHNQRKLRIKLEIDTNPPQGSTCETSYITFPATFALTSQTLESSFALKLHALLCRSYTKGRDWFDFVWYAARSTKPNMALLQAALMQQGPWQGEKIDLDAQWLHDALAAIISKTDWNIAKADVQRFLPLSEQQGLQLWSQDFFMQFIKSIG